MAPSIVDAVLRAPLEIFSVAQHRTYVPFLASSALLAAWVWRTSGSRPRSLVSFMFPWRLWRSRSSRLDIQLLLGNAVVRVVVFAPVVVSAMTVLLAVAGTLTRWLGPPEPTTLPHWCVVGGFTLALFVADDLTRYLVHRAMHAIPALWAIHKIHHSAEVLTPLTLYRVHPLESFIMATRHAVTLGLVSALCYYVWPGRITQWELVGVNALSVGFSAIGSNLRHSHVWLSFGPKIERWVMSPAQHQIHHSSDPRHFGANYGVFLAIWDRLGHSLATTTRRGATTSLKFGIGEQKLHRDHLLSAYSSPLIEAARAWRRWLSSRAGRGRRALRGRTLPPETSRTLRPRR